MRVLRRLIRLGILAVAVLTALVAGSMSLSPHCDDLAATNDRYDLAIVLSAGFVANSLDDGSLDRTRAAVGLFERGVVDRLLMTGDALAGEWSAAANMRQIAVRGGVPADRVIIEPDSGSTLQNARFSLPLVPPGDRVLLVTEGFHLWRGWASFAWAGDPPEGICQSSPVADPTLPRIAGTVLYEVAAWAYNLFRAPVFSLANALGLDNRLPADFLR